MICHSFKSVQHTCIFAHELLSVPVISMSMFSFKGSGFHLSKLHAYHHVHWPKLSRHNRLNELLKGAKSPSDSLRRVWKEVETRAPPPILKNLNTTLAETLYYDQSKHLLSSHHKASVSHHACPERCTKIYIYMLWWNFAMEFCKYKVCVLVLENIVPSGSGILYMYTYSPPSINVTFISVNPL
jgi:hypothetical protein